MLADETATHYPAAQGFAFSVVYHLTSIRRRKRLRLRILIPEGFEPDSAVTGLPHRQLAGAGDLGHARASASQGHPDMTRILCPEGWEGHALRKEYPTLGLGQRDIDFREDRSGVLMRLAHGKGRQPGHQPQPPQGGITHRI